MKILFISKYPPIEGGVASQNYWLAKALGEKGAEISILTNAMLVEDEWRDKLDLGDIATLKFHQPKNVFFYSLTKTAPFHIPYSQAYLSRLVNLGLKIISERKIQIIYAHYLEPYATAGFILKKITGLPLAIRHAGSDVYRLFKNQDFCYFFGEVMAEADTLIFSLPLAGIADALDFNRKKIVIPPLGAADASAFNPEGEKFDFQKYGAKNVPGDIPIFVYLGKASALKGILEAIDAMRLIKRDFRFVFVSGGKDASKFITEGEQKLGNKFIHLPFIPPWEVPALMRSASALLHLENKFPIPIHSPIQPYEAVSAGTPLILTAEIFNKLAPRFPKTKSDFTFIDNPADTEKLHNIFQEIIGGQEKFRKKALNIREEFILRGDWNRFVDFYDSLFQKLSARRNRFWPF